MKDKIELLPISLITAHPDTVALVDDTVRELNLMYGWHYILDFVWLLEQVRASGLPAGSMILDAGAGLGAAQFCLARLGYNITSVDFARRSPSLRMLRNYRVSQSGELDGNFDHDYLDKNTESHKGKARIASATPSPGTRSLISATRAVTTRFLAQLAPGPAVRRMNRGRLILHRADLRNMRGIPDASMDAVVSVSALEHNSEEQVLAIMKELNRVLKPGAHLFITTSASGQKDWFHEPSHGWCYSEESLRRLFLESTEDLESNYGQYPALLQEMVKSEEIKERLHPLYFKSGDNGMPWGRWDPKYHPVGLMHRKKSGC